MWTFRRRVVMAASAVALAGGVFGAVGSAQASVDSCKPLGQGQDLCIQTEHGPGFSDGVVFVGTPPWYGDATGVGVLCQPDSGSTMSLAVIVISNGQQTPIPVGGLPNVGCPAL